jgi:hypothetical protein
MVAVHKVFPHAKWRECFRHLIQNYIKQFPGKEHLCPEARVYRSEVYEQHKRNFIGIENVALWFKQNHSLLWYRSGFSPEIKYDYITNNIAEVFNN